MTEPPARTAHVFRSSICAGILTALSACSVVVSTDGLASGVTGADAQAGTQVRDGGGVSLAPAAEAGAPSTGSIDASVVDRDAATNDASAVPDPLPGDAATAPDARDAAPPTACSTGARVFVTQTMYPPAFGGTSGADQRCQSSADAHVLGGTWKAWLSDTNSSAPQRIQAAPAGYVLLDGTLVAANGPGLLSGSLLHAIDRSEANARITDGNTEVWTGFDVLGNFINPGFCSSASGDWTSTSSGAPTPLVGHLDATDATWSAAYLQVCDRSNVRLYCFEICP
jgi:hypothetical protein